jgi:probable addiction module antidote protein/putative addiction module killer protein
VIEIIKMATFGDWMAGLSDIRLRANIAARIDRMALGDPSDVHVACVGIDALWIDYGPGYRVYFSRNSMRRKRRRVTRIMLWCGGDRSLVVWGPLDDVPRKIGTHTIDLDFALSRYDSVKYLDSDEAIVAYLEEVLKADDSAFTTHALGVAARARGMSLIAHKTGLSCDRLRKALSQKGNPKFGTIARVMRALGLRFSVTAAEPPRMETDALGTPTDTPAPAPSRRQQARRNIPRRSECRSADRSQSRRPRQPPRKPQVRARGRRGALQRP